MTYTALRLERRDKIAEVVLNNPGRLNAMEPAFFAELRDVFGALSVDAEVRAVIVWAEGRAFSTGLDKELSLNLLPPSRPGDSTAQRAALLHAKIHDFQASMESVRRCAKPVIAAVNGLCIGGGLDLATACDVRLCTGDASFSIHETRVAMVADLGTLQRLPRLIGRGLVREMALSGRPIDAQRALAAGLVNAILPNKEALLGAARAMAQDFAQNSPLVVQALKQVLDYSETHTERDGLDYVALWNAAFFFSNDLQEASDAFRSHRAPNYRGT